MKARRLHLEKITVKKYFPDFQLVENGNSIRWVGKIKPLLFPFSPAYKVEIHYTDNFAQEPPKVFVIFPKIKEEKHRWKDGSLCLFYPPDKSWKPSYTAATIISWVAEWLYCYTMWMMGNKRKWPGPEKPHKGPKRK